MIGIRRMALLALLVFALLGNIPVARAGEIVWEGSYAAAVKEAKRTGRPIMIDFFADWCGWCKKLDTDVYTADPVVKVAEKFISVKLNTETDAEGRALAKKHQITNLPTILFVNGAGEVVGQIRGFMPAPQFAHQMEKTLKAHQAVKDLPALRAKSERNPSDPTTAARLAQAYALTGKVDEAKAAFARIVKLDPNNAKDERAKTALALAEMYVEKRDVKNAVPLFQEAAKAGKDAKLVGYSRLSAAFGFILLNQPRKAVEELREVFSDPRLSDSDRQVATKILSQIPSPLW